MIILCSSSPLKNNNRPCRSPTQSTASSSSTERRSTTTSISLGILSCSAFAASSLSLSTASFSRRSTLAWRRPPRSPVSTRQTASSLSGRPLPTPTPTPCWRCLATTVSFSDDGDQPLPLPLGRHRTVTDKVLNNISPSYWMLYNFLFKFQHLAVYKFPAWIPVLYLLILLTAKLLKAAFLISLTFSWDWFWKENLQKCTLVGS